MAEPVEEFDVFLSHHSGDKPWVIFLKSALAARGVKVWLDRDEIRPGDLFIDALEQGVRSARTVALIVSPEGMKSAWVKAEYQQAMVLSKSVRPELRIIPCLLRDASLPGFLTILHWVDFRDPAKFEEKVEELCWGITGKKPRPGVAAPAPFAAPPAEVTAAEIAFLERSIAAKQQELRGLKVLRWVAPFLGLGLSFLWPQLSGPSNQVVHVAPPLVTGLLGFGATARKWSRYSDELKRLVIHRDALELCRRNPGPVCRDVVEAFNRLIRRSIGIDVPEGDRARV